MKNKKSQAFTLAEILIVLTIIGVMAVISIPSLVQNSNSQQKITLFKKAFNAVSNAYATEFAIKTPPKSWNEGNVVAAGGRKFWEALNNQLNVKYYGHWTTWKDFENIEKIYQKPATNDYLPWNYWIITEDGIGYLVTHNSETRICPDKLTLNGNSISTDYATDNYTCNIVLIDINSPFTGPNKICGRENVGFDNKDDLKNLTKCDIFYLFQTKEGITAGNPDTMIAAKILAGE